MGKKQGYAWDCLLDADGNLLQLPEVAKVLARERERSKALEEALRLCVLKRRGGTTLDSNVADEDLLQYVKRADTAARAALEQSK
jgi:hypothetical protein